MKKRMLKSKPVCKVTFELPAEAAPAASAVNLVGDFNDWDTGGTPMKRRKDGSFSVTIDLDTDREYQYKYLIDSQTWENDGPLTSTPPVRWATVTIPWSSSSPDANPSARLAARRLMELEAMASSREQRVFLGCPFQPGNPRGRTGPARRRAAGTVPPPRRRPATHASPAPCRDSRGRPRATPAQHEFGRPESGASRGAGAGLACGVAVSAMPGCRVRGYRGGKRGQGDR